ncbi:MAG: phage minor head protein [Marinifilaceae bacterium]
MNNLYHNYNAPELEFTFDKKAIKQALKAIYTQSISVSEDVEEHLFDEVCRILTDAVNIGVGENPDGYYDRLLHQLKNNVKVFSAFKVHRMQNDMAKQLYNEDGELKSFRQFRKDTASMVTHNVDNWLRSEYNTAILRAAIAAQWQQFESVKDVLPNVKWLPSTSIKPGEDHRVYWGVIRPVDDPFWTQHCPGDRWNCKCGLASTDKEPTPIPESSIASARGIDSHPKDGKIFTESHPYIEDAYANAPEAVRNFLRDTPEYRLNKAKEFITSCIERLRTGHVQGVAQEVGKLPKEILWYTKKNNITIPDDDIVISDQGIHHALRTVKQKLGKAVSEEDLINLPTIINDCEIYYDTDKNNFILFVPREDQSVKYVIQTNYKLKANGKKENRNVFITAGVLQDWTLTKGPYIRIK